MGLVAGGRGRIPPLGGTISQCNMEEEEGRLRNPPKINHEKRNQETRSFKLLHRREAHMGLGEVIEKEKSKEEGRRERKKEELGVFRVGWRQSGWSGEWGRESHPCIIVVIIIT